MKLVMKVAKTVSELNGKGLEYLTDDTGENIRAVFYDGNFVRCAKKLTKEESERQTVPMAA